MPQRHGSGSSSSVESAKESSCEAPAKESVVERKKKLITFEPIRLMSISTTAQQDTIGKRFAYQKVCERLRAKQRVEAELRNRISQLEKRQVSDDKLMVVINRFWNQLNHDVIVLLEKYDAETGLEEQNDSKNHHLDVKKFMETLQCGDDDELETRMSQRVEFTLRAIGKLVAAINSNSDRNVRISKMLEDFFELKESQDVKEKAGGEPEAKKLKYEDESEEGNDIKPDTDIKLSKDSITTQISAEIVKRNVQLEKENARLQRQLEKIHVKLRKLELEEKKFDDEVTLYENRCEEMTNRYENIHWQLEKNVIEIERYENRLCEMHRDLDQATAKMASLKSKAGNDEMSQDSTSDDALANVTKTKLESLEVDLAEQRELADTRLNEVNEYVQRVAKLESDLQTERIKLASTLEQSSDDSLLRRTQIALSRTQDDATYLRDRYMEVVEQMGKMKELHSEHIRSLADDEELTQRELQQEVLQQEETLEKVRREYEMLRLEFEQNLANNEQSGPMNKELRQQYNAVNQHLIQQKQEMDRYKRKWREGVSTITCMSKEISQLRKERDQALIIPLHESEQIDDVTLQRVADSPAKGSKPIVSLRAMLQDVFTQMPIANDDWSKFGLEKPATTSTVDSLNEQLEICLRVFKRLTSDVPNKDTADYRSLVVNVHRCRRVALKTLSELRRWHETTREDIKQYLTDEMNQKLQRLSEDNSKLQKEAANAKVEEETLLGEMESTGQAFEQQQEANQRLLAQLREKDEANFKLMTERIRLNQQQRKLEEEYESQKQLIQSLQMQTEAANQAVKHEAEQSKTLRLVIEARDKELTATRNTMESFRSKANLLLQKQADVQLECDRSKTQFEEANKCIRDKTIALENKVVAMRRLSEDNEILKKRLERAKKYEQSGQTSITKLLEEEIRQLKHDVTCQSCKKNRKDAILSKCNHIFCMECVKQRYEARQRRCPRCNVQFGASDYKKLYL